MDGLKENNSKNWKRLYAFVLIYLALLICLFIYLTNVLK